MAKHPPWKITVRRKDETIAYLEIPDHKLGRREVERFLHALVIRFRTRNAEDMIPYYVNNRRERPEPLPFARTIRYSSYDQSEQGYFCGQWECYAIATQTISDEQAAIIRQLHEQNRRSSETS